MIKGISTYDADSVTNSLGGKVTSELCSDSTAASVVPRHLSPDGSNLGLLVGVRHTCLPLCLHNETNIVNNALAQI
jgi:hypothetical protein